MRVVLTGTTGSDKEKVAESLALEAARQRSLPPNLRDHHTRGFIRVFSVEDEIKNTIGDLRPFLDQVLKTARSDRWQKAMEKILHQAEGCEHSILCFHNVFYRRSNFFTAVDWDLLTAYHPTVFVTLINDVYDTWQTINDRERAQRTNSFFRLPEILAWRSAEFSSTESLAENLYVKGFRHGLRPQDLASLRTSQPTAAALFGDSVPHFIFSVKHPLQTLYRLLFRRDFLRVYASFPITATRNDPRGRAEIDDFRRRLFESDFLTVLDPLTIDELRLTPTHMSGQSAFLPRWPLTFGPPMRPDIDPSSDPFEGYSDLEYRTFKEALARHIEVRDYQMVSQANVLTAYRPHYGAPLGDSAPFTPSSSSNGGVEKELGFASILSLPIYAVHPPQDQREGVEVFRNISLAVRVPTVDELLVELKKEQERWAKRREDHGEAQTWE